MARVTSVSSSIQGGVSGKLSHEPRVGRRFGEVPSNVSGRSRETQGLCWPGKNRARQPARQPSALWEESPPCPTPAAARAERAHCGPNPPARAAFPVRGRCPPRPARPASHCVGGTPAAEELGGAQMHAEISGTVDFKEPNDHLCIARLRSLVDKMGTRHRHSIETARWETNPEVFQRQGIRCGTRCTPRFAAQDLYALLNPAPGQAMCTTCVR